MNTNVMAPEPAVRAACSQVSSDAICDALQLNSGAGALGALPPPHFSDTAAEPRPESGLQFPRAAGESPRAYSAFMTYFQSGHARSLQAVAERLDEGYETIRKWSSKFDWNDRIIAYNSGQLQRQAEAEAARQIAQAAALAQRVDELRNQEWNAAQQLLCAVQCYLENLGEEQLEKMTLGQVSRALAIASQVGRLAVVGLDLPVKAEPTVSKFETDMMDALRRAYGMPAEPKPDHRIAA